MLWLSLSKLFVCALRECTAPLSLGWGISALNSSAALALTETLLSNGFLQVLVPPQSDLQLLFLLLL